MKAVHTSETSFYFHGDIARRLSSSHSYVFVNNTCTGNTFWKSESPCCLTTVLVTSSCCLPPIPVYTHIYICRQIKTNTAVIKDLVVRKVRECLRCLHIYFMYPVLYKLAIKKRFVSGLIHFACLTLRAQHMRIMRMFWAHDAETNIWTQDTVRRS
jgi:hypothetical protein